VVDYTGDSDRLGKAFSLPRTQCRTEEGASDAAAAGPFKKQQAHGHRRENEKVFSGLAVISLVGTISGKSLKLLPPDVIFTAKMRQIRFVPLRELTTLPRNPNWN